jgi:hypothetical protein
VKSLAYLLFAAATWPTAAHGQSASPRDEPNDQSEPRPAYREQQPPQQPPIDSDAERPLPDYDGRGEEPTDAGDVLLWVPRVLLFPLYLVTEFMIRRPLGALATTAEENEWPPSLRGGPKKKHGFVPSGLIDHGLRASVGLYVWADDPLFAGHHLRLRATTGGAGYFNVVLKERIPIATRAQLAVRGEYDLRSDWVFHGLGPRSASEPVRFRARRFDSKLSFESRLWRTSAFAAWIGARDVAFSGDIDGQGDPNLDQAVASGRLSDFPPGFRDGYTLGVAGMRAALDSRRRRHADPLPPASDFVSTPGTGVRVSARAEQAVGLRDAGPSQNHEWIAWGGTAAGFVDIDQRHRILGLILNVDFVDPLDARAGLPFTELASLGGARPLRGFLAGRLLDRSAIALQLDYQYPIWVWLDGAAHYTVGNVFGPHLDDFDTRLLRSSFGLGIRSTGSRDHVFELLAAFGTETFADGGEIESFRLVAGATSGF